MPLTKGLNKRMSVNDWSEWRFEPRFWNSGFFEHRCLFLEIKKKTLSVFFQSETLGSGKTLSELHLHYKSLLKRVYNHAGCTKYLREKKILLKSGIVSYWCFWPVLMSILCLVMHILCVHALKLLSGFSGTMSGVFGEDRLATLSFSPSLSHFAFYG